MLLELKYRRKMCAFPSFKGLSMIKCRALAKQKQWEHGRKVAHLLLK